MTIPATPAITEKPYAKHLLDRAQGLSQAEAEEYLADLRATLAKDILPPVYRLHCLSLLSAALMRLDRMQEAYEPIHEAAARYPNATTFGNLGGALLNLGDLQNALLWLERAVSLVRAGESTVDHGVGILGNLAEVYWRCGMSSEAMSTIQEAINAADPHDARSMFGIAVQLAEMGLHAETVEFLARCFALRNGFELGDECASDVVRRFQDEYRGPLSQFPKVRYSIDFILAFEDALKAPEEEHSGDGSGALAMFEATRSMREQATRAIVGHEGGLS